MYFVLLDQSLEEPKTEEDIRDGVRGELWEVHGGGFYHVKKYKVAPPVLPDHLAWFKWEAYTTWLSGFALMVVLYYFNANAYLIDPSVADLSSWEAVGISIALLVVAWVVYDVLCRLLLPRGRNGEIALWVAARPADDARRLGLRPAVPAARRVPPGRRDARHDHGGERLLQHHPRPLGADQRQEGRPRARPDAGHHRQEALGPQQLLHAAGAVHDARRALRVRLRRGPRLARPDRDHAARRADARVLQPAPPGPHDLGPAGARRRRRAPARLGDQAGRRRQRQQRADDRLLAGGAGDRAAVRTVPRAGPDRARLLEPAGRDRPRDARSRSRRGRTRSRASSRRR